MDGNFESSARNYKVPAVDQAIRIMLCLADNPSIPKSLTEICREVGVHRSKAFSILNTLNEYGFVKKNPNRKGYVLGPRLLMLTGKMLENLSLPRLVDPILSDLAKKAGATVALGMISDNHTYVVAQYEGAPGLGVSAPIGYVTPVTYGAHGKAIAAFLTERELEELLQKQKPYFHGTPDKFDKSRLLEEIALCRRQGYSIEMGNLTPGLNAIASAILDHNRRPIGYITVVGFFSEEDTSKLGPLTAEAAQKISSEMGNIIFWKKPENR